MTLGEMEVPVAWLGRGTKAPLSPSGSCFGSWLCHPGQWWSGVKWSWGEVFSDSPMGPCPTPMDGVRGLKDHPWGLDSPCASCSPVAALMLTPFGNHPSSCRAGQEPGCGNGREGGVSRCRGTDGWKFSPRRAYVEQKAVELVASHTVSHWALNTPPQAVPPSSPWELCVLDPAATE